MSEIHRDATRRVDKDTHGTGLNGTRFIARKRIREHGGKLRFGIEDDAHTAEGDREPLAHPTEGDH